MVTILTQHSTVPKSEMSGHFSGGSLCAKTMSLSHFSPSMIERHADELIKFAPVANSQRATTPSSGAVSSSQGMAVETKLHKSYVRP